MAPPTEKIVELMTQALPWQTNASPETTAEAKLAAIENMVSNDITATMVGQEFQLASQFKGIAALREYLGTRLFPAFMTSIDTAKPTKSEVVRVIGGGDSPWVAVEVKGTATSKTGRPWLHEAVILYKFTDDGKVSEARIYCDTLHIQNHLLETSG